MSPEEKLLGRLLVEMFQTEESARVHFVEEARRLPDSPPALALRTLAEHSVQVQPELLAVCEREGFRLRAGGRAIGRFFSLFRRIFSDPLLSQEKSYRATLLGAQHGLDCGLLAAAVARACGRDMLASFFERWLEQRRPLVVECRQHVGWFADHGELALRKAGLA